MKRKAEKEHEAKAAAANQEKGPGKCGEDEHINDDEPEKRDNDDEPEKNGNDENIDQDEESDSSDSARSGEEETPEKKKTSQ